MKVLICNTLENKGGAARVSKRIYESLKQLNVDTQYLFLFKDGEEKKSIIPKIDAIPKIVFLKDRKIPFSTSLLSFGGKQKIEKYKPDILHLNYINMGMLSIKEIGSFDTPIVWTLHDSWAFTGGFHLPNNEEINLFRFGFDLGKYILNEKKRYWTKKNITFVCPSKWMFENVKRSGLFNEYNTLVIPNPINTKIFKPFDKEIARKRFNLDMDKKYILFGSVNPLKDKNKGFELLKDTLKNFKTTDTELLIYGTDEEVLDLPIRSRSMGYIEKEEDIALLYSASDVTVVPSLSENFPTALVESLACGTRVVGFNIGGIPEIISKEEYGELVESYNTKKLSEAIEEVLIDSDTTDREYLHKEIEMRYGYDVIGRRYKQLYEELTM